MVTRTINSIVRETLIDCKLTLHFYVEFLLIALNEMRRLSVHHKMSVKQVELSINGYNRVPIPDDMLYMVDLSIKSGERLLPAVRDRNLNRLYNFDDQGNKIPFPEAVSEEGPETILVDFLDDYYYDLNRFGFGGYFGLNTPQDRTFNVDYQNGEIVFSNNFHRDTVVLTYATNPVSPTTANLVREEFVDVLKSKMKHSYYQMNQFPQVKIDEAKDDYVNAKRNMRALIYPTTRADLVYQIRRGIHGSLKL